MSEQCALMAVVPKNRLHNPKNSFKEASSSKLPPLNFGSAGQPASRRYSRELGKQKRARSSWKPECAVPAGMQQPAHRLKRGESQARKNIHSVRKEQSENVHTSLTALHSRVWAFSPHCSASRPRSLWAKASVAKGCVRCASLPSKTMAFPRE